MTVLLLLIISLLLGYGYYRKLDYADKMTTLPMHTWLDIYTKAGFFEKGRLATAVLAAAMRHFPEYYRTLSLQDVIEVKNKSGLKMSDYLENLFITTKEDLAKHLGFSEMINLTAARYFSFAIFLIDNEEALKMWLSFHSDSGSDENEKIE